MESTLRTTTINLTVPESVRTCIEAEVARGGYSSASEYICDLVSHATRDTPQRRLETLLLEGLDSGPGEELTPELWETMRITVAATVATRAASRSTS